MKTICDPNVCKSATLLAGRPWPQGASFDGSGVNFAVFSAHAESVTLCLFDRSGVRELAALPVTECSDGVWHGYLAGAEPGLVYAWRVEGPSGPGHRFDADRYLLDPYARSLVGLKAQVVDTGFDWCDDAHPRTPWAKTVIYEAHVRGLTRLQPDVPEPLRGTYAGLAHPSVIGYLHELGVTALELMPVQHFLDEPRLLAQGLVNYWGYNPIAWFAPSPRYAVSNGVSVLDQFRQMVHELHRAGIEVILDVVFNHSAEGDASGPALSLRGIDNVSYYVLDPAGEYENWTGCGNALNVAHSRVLQLVMDCLRYWVGECHVDGFRFDLATTLGRDAHGFNPAAPLFAAILQDPVLAGCKLIAEPWDVGPAGYRLGQFPCGWAEWNDQFRDALRRFWLHDGVSRAEFARRFAASSDLFAGAVRQPNASLNYLTAHDGFTLADLASYNHKHNLANGEHNRDGHGHNLSWNCGVEGPSDEPHVNLLRLRVRRAMFASLLLAQGTPMLLAGDEIGHSQQGNNNAYCQDNEITWLGWEQAEPGLAKFVADLLATRREIPALTSGRWWTGLPDDAGVTDVQWLNPAGTPLETHDWHDPAGKALMIVLSDIWLLLINASGHQVHFRLPPGNWCLRLSSADDSAACGGEFTASARSVAVLRQE